MPGNSVDGHKSEEPTLIRTPGGENHSALLRSISAPPPDDHPSAWSLQSGMVAIGTTIPIQLLVQ